jgi:genome maintenance exonuclease 1
MMTVYPRVTEILQATQSQDTKDRLRRWFLAQQRKGLDPQQLSNQAKAQGTHFHQAIETYLTTGVQPQFVDILANPQDSLALQRWRCALPHLQALRHDVLCLEQAVVSHKLRYQGHLDCLVWDGPRLVVIDWKTSQRFKKRQWIEDYFIQATAYALAAYECGVAPVLPEVVKIYLFSPQRTQVFSESVATFGPAWLERLSQYQQLVESVA